MRAAFERSKPEAPGMTGSKPMRLVIELEGPYEIVRFCVNLLDHQVEFGQLGQEALYRVMRELGQARFESYLRYLMGEERAEKLKRWRQYGRPERMRFRRSLEDVVAGRRG